MNVKIIISSIAAMLFLAGVYVFAGQQYGIETGTRASADGVPILYDGYVTVEKFDAKTGSWITLEKNKHNLLVDNGKNYIRTQIGNGSAVASNSTKYISLSNSASAPAAGDTVIPSEINANGLERAAATYSNNGTGAWNYTYTWTATGTQSVQLTGLNYAPTAASDGNLFASLQFTGATLAANDQLRVVWSISVS